MASYEVIVVGGGHNSLTSAAYLAAAGLKVLVLDKNPVVGGGSVSREITAPGYIHDTHAGQMVLIMANPLIAKDELGLMSKFGLKFSQPSAGHVTVFDDNTYLSTYFSVDKTCESIARFSQRDAEAYRKLVATAESMSDLFVSGLFKPPLPFGGFIAMLDQSLQGQQMIGSMLKSAYDVICELYEHEKVRIHFLKWVSELMIGPEEKGTGIIPIFLAAMQHKYHPGAVVGGSGKLSEALADCIRHHGGEVRTETEVTKIHTTGGRASGVTLASGERIDATKAVVANLHPWLLDSMVEGLDEGVATRARQVRLSAFGAVNTHWALKEAPRYKAGPEVDSAAVVEPAPSTMLRFRQHFDQMRYGQIPDSINASVQHNSNYDPTRVPNGQGASLYLYHFVPFKLAGKELSHWDDIKGQVLEEMLVRYQQVTTNMTSDNIIASAIETPWDMHQWSPSFQNGDLMGIGTYIDQWLGRRPTPELAQYRVPGISGLYLSGPCYHPGGTVTGGGRATAMQLMGDLKIKYDGIMAV
ncbi:MAG: NAD(P)/FAD-dependent oxidoreductase [Tissierellales bacterium]